MAYRYFGEYYRTVLKHYEPAGSHFDNVDGYEHYAQGAKAMRERSEDSTADFYTKLPVSGTPDRCVDKIANIAEDTGTDHFFGCFHLRQAFSRGGHAEPSALQQQGAAATEDLVAKGIMPTRH